MIESYDFENVLQRVKRTVPHWASVKADELIRLSRENSTPEGMAIVILIESAFQEGVNKTRREGISRR